MGPDILSRARAVRLAIFDVDGVLTDGTVWIGPEGESFKAFNILDGHGIKMLQAAGIDTAILSGRESQAVVRRAGELAIRHVVQGAGDKLAAFERLLADAGCRAEACSFMGDDLPDLAVLRRCGFAVAVANAGRRGEGGRALRDARFGRPRRGARILRPGSRRARATRPRPGGLTKPCARLPGCRSPSSRSSSGSRSG
jgi:3-deoxy-D-manno-octulosonate 8-phosphate phosphatase (KDO 8-P phosphatase)